MAQKIEQAVATLDRVSDAGKVLCLLGPHLASAVLCDTLSEYRNKWLDRICAKLHSELPYSLSISLMVLNRMIVIDNALG